MSGQLQFEFLQQEAELGFGLGIAIAVNIWIRESGAFDGVADFDAALRDPEIPTQMRAVDDCGDGLHPSDSGYCKMGDAIDLTLFG